MPALKESFADSRLIRARDDNAIFNVVLREMEKSLARTRFSLLTI